MEKVVVRPRELWVSPALDKRLLFISILSGASYNSLIFSCGGQYMENPINFSFQLNLNQLYFLLMWF